MTEGGKAPSGQPPPGPRPPRLGLSVGMVSLCHFEVLGLCERCFYCFLVV